MGLLPGFGVGGGGGGGGGSDYGLEDDDYYGPFYMNDELFPDEYPCGGLSCEHPSLNISTIPTAQGDVVRDGSPQSKFTTTCKRCAVYTPAQEVVTFWIFDKRPQEWEMPYVNVDKGSVVRASLSGSAAVDRRPVDYPANLTIQFQCIKKGSSKIKVTIPTKGYNNKSADVAFTFLKSCAGDIEEQDASTWTAPRAFATLLLVVTFGAAALYLWYYQKKPRHEYTLVGKAKPKAVPTAAELEQEEYAQRDHDSESDE
jgi:hypothetical protein